MANRGTAEARGAMTAKVATIIAKSALEELASQARQFGYLPGAVMVFIRDRLEQIADPVVAAKLPPVEPSWPPPRAPRGRRWFVKDGGDAGCKMVRKRARPGCKIEPLDRAA